MRSHFLRAAQKAGGTPENPFVLVGSSTVGTATSGATISVDIPDGTAAGDFILVVHAARSTSDLDMTLADGSYAKIADLYSNDTFDANLGVHWKISDGTEVSLALPGGAGFVVATCSVQVWRGADQSTPLDVVSVTSTGTNTGLAVNSSISTVSDGCVVLAAAAVMTGSSDTVITQPDGFLDATIAAYPAGASVPTRAAVASKPAPSAGLSAGGQWTHAFSSGLYSWCACTLALRPA